MRDDRQRAGNRTEELNDLLAAEGRPPPLRASLHPLAERQGLVN